MSKKIYDEIYTKVREILSGYEYARWHALRHFISKVIKLQNNKMVLDYGCGNGLFVGLFKEIFIRLSYTFATLVQWHLNNFRINILNIVQIV